MSQPKGPIIFRYSKNGKKLTISNCQLSIANYSLPIWTKCEQRTQAGAGLCQAQQNLGIV